MIKSTKVLRIVAITMLLVMMFSTLSFAETKIFNVGDDDEWSGDLKGDLEISNYKEDITGLIGDTINTISIDSLFDNSEYNDIKYLDGAFIVGKGSKITVKLDKPTMAELSIYKLTKKGEEYEYMYRERLPIASGKIEALEEGIEDGLDTYHSGVTIELNETGEYLVKFFIADLAMINGKSVFIRVVEDTLTEEQVEEPKTEPVANAIATPTSSMVLVNNVETTFDAYLIGGNNYFKLRDLSYVVNGSEKQFAVEWDGQKKAINLISNKPYTELGSEMLIGDGLEKTATLNKSKIYLDAAEVELTAYTINNQNYFKLRDLGKAFDINVTWNNDTKTVGIDTSTGYIE